MKNWKIAQKNEIRNWLRKKDRPQFKKETRAFFYTSNFLKPLDLEEKIANKIVLEIGCGPFGIVNFLEKSACIGIDPLMYELAKSFNLPKRENLVFLKGVGERIPAKSESVDFVFCLNVLDHTAFPELVINEVIRILKVGGYAVFNVNVWPKLFWLFTSKKKKEKERNYHLHFWEPCHLLSMFEIPFVSIERVIYKEPKKWWQRLLFKMMREKYAKNITLMIRKSSVAII